MKNLLNLKLGLTVLLSMTFLLMKPLAAIPAFLPTVDTVPAGQPMAIDGVWNISAINKRIRYEGGRAYAVDDWYHMVVLHIQPDMVTQQNIKQTASGTYIGDDLPMVAKSSAKLQANGNLKYVAGLFASDLVPVQLDYPDLMAEELQRLGGADNGAPPAANPNPPQSNCKDWAIDPDTNKPVCLD